MLFLLKATSNVLRDPQNNAIVEMAQKDVLAECFFNVKGNI
ncbi:hypothetical protein RBWH47_05609 [Rhodopirellula baltica WH47]|uniref:Uncharacterized protein n=1 Tax=Rhodopirellula baltica WH47 TaxID=991778 RepID=F2ATH9_RHOBT|nr:hypothetical protein RBWH47_05609 [Rhodopirellula baltica WH47]